MITPFPSQAVSSRFALRLNPARLSSTILATDSLVIDGLQLDGAVPSRSPAGQASRPNRNVAPEAICLLQEWTAYWRQARKAGRQAVLLPLVNALQLGSGLPPLTQEQLLVRRQGVPPLIAR